MRFRLQPTAAQEAVLLEHCAHARFVWNLAVEQHWHWRPGRVSAPGYMEQSRQLTEARAAFGWLAAGSYTVRQQALRDFAQAMANFFAGTHRRPTWREADRRKDWVEKTSTELAHRFDVIRVEDLKMWRRSIPRTRPRPATPAGIAMPKNRESQAVFRCRACGHAAHADVNAARNIAVG
jgi:transposase